MAKRPVVWPAECFYTHNGCLPVRPPTRSAVAARAARQCNRLDRIGLRISLFWFFVSVHLLLLMLFAVRLDLLDLMRSIFKPVFTFTNSGF
jgi:hypothetical protein